MVIRILVVLLAVVFCGQASVLLSWGGNVSEGMVVRYSFDAGAADNGRTHGPSAVNDRMGREQAAFRFDGMDDWVGIDHFDCKLNYDRDWSLNVWIYLDGSGKHSVFFAGADGDSGAKQFAVASQYVKLTHRSDTASDWRVNFKEVSHNTWHMYTVTWASSGHLKVYVDGVFKGEDLEGELADFCPEHEPVIGAVNFFRKTQYFKGRIDDFRIYDRVLQPTEINELFTLKE